MRNKKKTKLTTEQSALLALIRSALWGTEPPKKPEIAMDEARKQALIPLLFPDSKLAKFSYLYSVRLLHAQDELIALMREAGIPLIILKGSAAAVYYPNPIQRSMGDVDCIVPQDRFLEATELLTANGYAQTNADKDVDRHCVFVRKGFLVELHHHFSYEGIDVESYVTAGLHDPTIIRVEEYEVPVLDELGNGMVLLAHVAHHLQNGLGLRQVIDWMMYCSAVLDDEMWKTRFQKAAQECGLETLAVTLTRMCQLYLGLTASITWCSGADESLCDELLMNLLRSGNFGHANGSGARVEIVTTNIKRYGLFRYLQKAGESNWSAYRRHRWLKPFCWLYQIFRYARQGLRTRRNYRQLASDLNRSDERYALLTKLGIK